MMMLNQETLQRRLQARFTHPTQSCFMSSIDVHTHYCYQTYVSLQSHATSKVGGPKKNFTSFLKAATTTLLHTINESEKATYVTHINIYLADDPFLKKYLPLDPATNDLFDLAKDRVLLCKLINVAVPNTIDERAINTKRVLNPWERNENHTLCLNSAKAIGCTVVNIGTQDLIEGRPHLVLGLISQLIKTDPTQSCFMSSIDVHTHYCYQVMLPEAIAIVMVPRDSSRKHGIFRLATPGGMSVVRHCDKRGFHPHDELPNGEPLYKQCTDVYINPKLKFDVIDLR